MNYKAIYENFIADRMANPTKELLVQSHYIIPLQLGGSREPSNLIRLSIRDFNFAIILLHRIYPNFGTANRKEGSRKLAKEQIANMPKSNAANIATRMAKQAKYNDTRLFRGWYKKNSPAMANMVYTVLQDYLKMNNPTEADICFNFGKHGNKVLTNFIEKFKDFITLKNSKVPQVEHVKPVEPTVLEDVVGLPEVPPVTPAEDVAKADPAIEKHRLPEIVNTIKEYDIELGAVTPSENGVAELGVFAGADQLLRKYCDDKKNTIVASDINNLLNTVISIEYEKETDATPVYGTLPPDVIALIKRDAVRIVTQYIQNQYVSRADRPSLKTGGDRYARNFILSQAKAYIKGRVMSYCYLHPVTSTGFLRDDIVFKGAVQGHSFSTKESIAYVNAIKAGDPNLVEKRPSSMPKLALALQHLVNYDAIYMGEYSAGVKTRVSMAIAALFDKKATEWVKNNPYRFFDGVVAAKLIQEITIETLKSFKTIERR